MQKIIVYIFNKDDDDYLTTFLNANNYNWQYEE